MTWLVTAAPQVRSCPAIVPSREGCAEAGNLESVVQSLPTDDQSSNLGVCGPAKAAKLQKRGPDDGHA